MRQLGASLLVTTYQAGKLVMVRDEGDYLNTHFRTTVQEVFAVTLLPGRRRPELIHDDPSVLEHSFVLPDAALADVPAAARRPPTRPPARRGSAASRPSRASVREVERERFTTTGATHHE